VRSFRNNHPQGGSTAFFFGGKILSFFNKEIGKILGKNKFNDILTNFTNLKKSPKFQNQKMKKKKKKKKKKNTVWGAKASYFGNSRAPRELSNIMCVHVKK
jgi:hypothetical protein